MGRMGVKSGLFCKLQSIFSAIETDSFGDAIDVDLGKVQDACKDGDLCLKQGLKILISFIRAGACVKNAFAVAVDEI